MRQLLIVSVIFAFAGCSSDESYVEPRSDPESVRPNILLPLFFLARGLTYVGWVRTRHETETARELSPMILAMACEKAEHYLQN